MFLMLLKFLARIGREITLGSRRYTLQFKASAENYSANYYSDKDSRNYRIVILKQGW